MDPISFIFYASLQNKRNISRNSPYFLYSFSNKIVPWKAIQVLFVILFVIYVDNNTHSFSGEVEVDHEQAARSPSRDKSHERSRSNSRSMSRSRSRSRSASQNSARSPSP